MTNNEPAPGDQPYGTPHPQGGYYGPAPMLESEARTMSLLAHLLVSVGGFVAPLVFWLIYKDRSALVAHHGKEQLNFQISVAIYYIALMILTATGFGAILALPALIALGIYVLVIVIVAAVAANRGEYYRIPLNIRMIT